MIYLEFTRFFGRWDFNLGIGLHARFYLLYNTTSLHLLLCRWLPDGWGKINIFGQLITKISWKLITKFHVTQSTLIGWKYYESSWYNLPCNQARSLMFIGHRARKPLVITAGGFCIFSKNLFISVSIYYQHHKVCYLKKKKNDTLLQIIKTSFGYLSMLRAVQEQLDE